MSKLKVSAIHDPDNDNLAIGVDTAGNVGIGTSSPSYLCHINGSGDAVAAVTAGATSIAALNLGNSTNLADGGIRYDNSADALLFRAGNAERMRILSGGGLTFNGDTATANALDDYEEGTWTPGISGRSFSSVQGTYKKIGNICFVTFSLNSMSGGSVSDPTFTGLPINTDSTSDYNYIYIHEPYNVSLSTNYTTLYVRPDPNNSSGIILQSTGETHSTGVSLSNGANLRGAGFFHTQ